MAIQTSPIADVFDTYGTWFTDIDDGTMVRITIGERSVIGNTVIPPSIRLFQNTVPYECHEMQYDQEVINTNPGTLTLNGYKLDIDNLPSDFSSDNSAECSLARLNDRLVLYVYEVTPSRQDLPSTLITADLGDEKLAQGPIGGFITRYEFVNVEEIGTTTTSANQSYSAGSDIELPTKGTPTVYLEELGKNKWTVVENFTNSGPTSKVFTYDKNSGTVTFGDGVNGAIPPAGKKVILRISIREGGGKWKYNGIVVQPATDPTSLGLLKALRKKIFYGATKIAGADAAVVTEVESTLNVIEQQHIGLDGSTLMGVYRVWSLAYGGEVKITTGAPNVKNTTVGKKFVVERGNVIPANPPSQPRPRRYMQWTGEFSQEVTGTLPSQQPDGVDNDEIHFFNGDAPGDGLGGFSDNDGENYKAQVDTAEMGFFTTPEVYKAVFEILPIFWIKEEVWHFREDTSTQQIGVFPTVLEVTLNGYDADEAYFARMGFIPSNHDQGSIPETYVKDINRKLAITAIANEEGTVEDPVFDEEQILSELAEGRFKQTIESPTLNWTVVSFPNSGSVGSFIYQNSDNDTEHPEWFRMTMVCTSKYEDYETHIFGEPLPNFVINWTVKQGTKTVYTSTNVLPEDTEDTIWVMG